MENPGVYIYKDILYKYWPTSVYWPAFLCVTHITEGVRCNGIGCACNTMSFLKNFVLKVTLGYIFYEKWTKNGKVVKPQGKYYIDGVKPRFYYVFCVKYENSFLPANMSRSRRNSSSRRTANRIASASFIQDFAYPSLSSCTHCSGYSLDCYSFDDSRCSRCVRSGIEGSCDAKMDPRSKRTLKKQKDTLRKA